VKAGDAFSKEVGGTLHECNGYFATTQPLQIVHVRLNSAQIPLPTAHGVEEHLTGARQSHSLGKTLKEWHAEGFLELQNLAIDRGRHDVKVLGGAPNGAAASDLVEIGGASTENHMDPLATPVERRVYSFFERKGLILDMD